jgi:hypothetical protein
MISATNEKFEREIKRQTVTAIKLVIRPEPNEVRIIIKEPTKINILESMLAASSLGPCFLSKYSTRKSINTNENVNNSLLFVSGT